jgi:hypothetical protein
MMTKRNKPDKKVKDLPAKPLGHGQAKGVKGGVPQPPPDRNRLPQGPPDIPSGPPQRNQ